MVTEGARAFVAEFQAARGQALFRYAYLLTGNAEDAQDLVQDAMVSLLGRSGSDIADPNGYVRRITNAWISQGRRRTRFNLLRPRLVADDRTSDEGDVTADRDLVWRMLDRLGERQRAAIVLRYYEDLSDAQVAEALGCAIGTVRSLVSRGLAAMRADLAATPQEKREHDEP